MKTIIALILSTINIVIKLNIVPNIALFVEKYLKLGRKLGADPIFNNAHAMLVMINVKRNAIVINIAI